MNDYIETIAETELPVDEELRIKRHRFMPDNISPDKIMEDKKRISIVTGIHGDELEGQYVCYKLSKRLYENQQALSGIVDIYPAMNPFGIDSITRGIPAFDLDMNRLFPGNRNGDMNEYIAAEILKDLEGSTLCVDIHASNIFLTEIPQIRINTLHKEKLVPIAMHSNVDFVWVHGASTVLESTLAYSLNCRNINTLVVEMGVGMRITESYGDQMVDGIFSLMKELGIWSGETGDIRIPIVSNDESGEDVSYMNAAVSGIFIKKIEHGSMVKEGEIVGYIVNPLTGQLIEDVKAPISGWLFTIREYPVVEEGSLIGRILSQKVL